MAKETKIETGLRCSFCTKSSDEVGRLVAGPGVYICDGCVGLAATVIEQSQDRPVSRMPMWDSLGDEEMLGHLGRSVRVADQVEADLRAWVAELRRRGVTWARIGESLGVTRQSAWERFSGEE